MSVAFILNPGYNTINNVHHTFWDQEGDAIKNSSLTQALAVSTSVAAPSHVITGGTNPAQLFMSDPITLETDAPQFKAPILQAPSAELEEVTELTQDAGITFLNDVHFTSGTGPSTVVRDIDGVGTLTCDILKYTTLDPAIPEADVSQWATFGASANVNLNGKNLTDSTRSAVFIPQNITAITTSDGGLFDFGNSSTEPYAESSINLYTRGYSDASAQLRVIPSTRENSQTYGSKAGSSTLYANRGDIQLGTTSTGGNLRLCYNTMRGAHTVNYLGALAFNSTFANGTETAGNFGTAGQIVQSNGSSAPPSWVAAPTASNWSTFSATQNVAMAAHELTNCAYLEVKPVGNSLGMIIENTLLDPGSDASFALQTDGDGDTIPAAITSMSLKPSNAPNTSWEQQPSTLVVKTTDKAAFACSDFIKVKQDDNTKAFVMNNAGALSFDTDFNAGSPSYSFGTSGQLLSSNGDDAPSWVDAPTASNWSTFAATSDADMGTHQLTNCSAVDITTNSGYGLTIQNPLLDNYNIAGLFLRNIGNGSTIPSSSADMVVNGSNFQNNGWTRTPSALNIGSQGDVVFNTEKIIKVNKASPSSAFVMNNAGALSFGTSFNSGSPLYNFGTSGQLLSSNGSAAPSWISQPVSGRYVFYVATNGLDANAGDITNPKLTIQSAINSATALYPQQVAIIIAPGVYSGNLSITRPNITLLGYAPSSAQNLLTQIAGNVSIACTASQDLFYSQVCIYNLQISGLISDTSSVVHTLNIEQCRLTNTGQVFAQTSSANNRTRLFRCFILQSAVTADVNPMLLFSSGDIYLNELEVTAKNNCNVVKFNGTAKCPTCSICLFNSDTTSTVAEPIVLIAPTDGTNYPFVFTQSAFVYSSYAPKLSHPESAGICVSSTAGRPYISVSYNTFALAGTNASNYAIYDTGYNTATAGYYFYFSNNGGVNPAGIHAVVPSLTDFGPQASAIYGFATGASQNKYTLSAVA